jgi:hypothetical protein
METIEELKKEIEYLKEQLQKEYEATCAAKDIIVDLINEKRKLEIELEFIKALTRY